MGFFDSIFGGSPNIEKLQKNRDVDGLIKALSHSQTYIREQAAHALGGIKDARSIEPLSQALSDQSSDVQLKAAQSLKQFDGTQITRVLPKVDAILDHASQQQKKEEEAQAKKVAEQKKREEEEQKRKNMEAQQKKPAARITPKKDASDVSRFDIMAIGMYLTTLAEQWWQRQPEGKTSATCDVCSGSVARNTGCLIGSSLYCNDCGKSNLTLNNLNDLKRNPDFYGAGVLRQARELFTSAAFISAMIKSSEEARKIFSSEEFLDYKATHNPEAGSNSQVQSSSDNSVCVKCGRQLVFANDKQFMLWAMSDDSRGNAVAFRCPRCKKHYCSSCMLSTNRTSPCCNSSVMNAV